MARIGNTTERDCPFRRKMRLNVYSIMQYDRDLLNNSKCSVDDAVRFK